MKSNRLISLDALRGFDMLWIIGGEMVIRNLAKGTNWPVINTLALQTTHKNWEGFHSYDLIMPLFLFMVGMAIPFSIGKRLSSGNSYRSIYLHTLKRSVVLFILGMVCQCNLLTFDFSKIILIHDTLQAIAIGYLFSVLIYTRFTLKLQLGIVSGLLLIYWIILTFIPVKGQAPGVLLIDSNIARTVEELALGRFGAHTKYTWVLGSLGFIASVMSGVFASTIIRGNFRLAIIKSSNLQIHKTYLLFIFGTILLLVSLILNHWFVVIKSLWNPTFVMLTSGISFLLMAIFYFIIDVKGYQRWAFAFKVIGMNSIAVYMASYLFPFQQIGHRFIFGLEQYLGSFYPVLNSVVSLAFVYLIMYWMYKKKTFIKI